MLSVPYLEPPSGFSFLNCTTPNNTARRCGLAYPDHRLRVRGDANDLAVEERAAQPLVLAHERSAFELSARTHGAHRLGPRLLVRVLHRGRWSWSWSRFVRFCRYRICRSRVS